MSENTERTDKFELCASVLLGLAAIFTALASFQAGLWDGKMVEAYGRANKIATASASEQSRAVVEMSKDASIDVTAMRLILEGEHGASATKELNYYIATYLYTRQMSDIGYKSLGLPPEAKKEDTESQTEEQAEQKQEAVSETILKKAMEKDLADDDNYRKEMLAKSQAQADEAEKVFKEGVDANENGDRFELINVIFAISLFFAGISLVMKTDIRWMLLGAGAVLFFCGAVYMIFIPWTFS